jgi:hypothetical protein
MPLQTLQELAAAARVRGRCKVHAGQCQVPAGSSRRGRGRQCMCCGVSHWPHCSNLRLGCAWMSLSWHTRHGRAQSRQYQCPLGTNRSLRCLTWHPLWHAVHSSITLPIFAGVLASLALQEAGAFVCCMCMRVCVCAFTELFIYLQSRLRLHEYPPPRTFRAVDGECQRTHT